MKYSQISLLALPVLLAVSASPIAEQVPESNPALPQIPETEHYVPRALKPAKHLRTFVQKRSAPGFPQGQPYDGQGKGAPLLGGTNKQLDLQNPENLGMESTDSGTVVNLKWSFSDSHTRLLKGGWVREQTVTDLPASNDIAAAQQHLIQGAYRELHWHRVAEWGYVYAGEILISAVDNDGKNQVAKLGVGDVWYFPKGQAHTIQGLAAQNEYLLVFDDSNFDALGTTFMVDDWIAHTPKDILAKNFGVNSSVFNNTPTTDPYMVEGTVNITDDNATPSPNGKLEGNGSYVYFSADHQPIQAPGGGGTLRIIDSTTFPIATTLAAAVVTVKPGALRELHWHPNAEEWLYFAQGQARATVFMGSATARTFDFYAGDTAVFPDNAGHYVENTSNTTDLIWIEVYKSDRIMDVSLTQWLALSPDQLVAQTLNISLSVVKQLKTTKQYIIA